MPPTSHQTLLHEYTTTQTPNLPPAGDSIPTAREDGILRFAFQNIHGATLHSGIQVAPEIDTLLDWDINIMGMSETNRPWTPQQKSVYDYMMDSCFSSSRTIYTSAAPPDHTFKHLQGGNLLTINGHTTGRICERGSDSLGRFCWVTLRGRRDEGVLVITAYRVCHESYWTLMQHRFFPRQINKHFVVGYATTVLPYGTLKKSARSFDTSGWRRRHRTGRVL